MSTFYNADAFFESWKTGVQIAGPVWFGDGLDPNSAETKWDLVPRVDEITARIDTMSSTERIFIAAMVSFYNDSLGGRLLQRAGGSKSIGMADIASSLDERRRRVIADLMLSYCGW
jgi:hypothetical protein